MAIDKVVAPLLRVPIFIGLKPLQLSEIARQAERVTFRRGTTITKAGTHGDGAVLIVSGEAVRLPDSGSSAPPQPIEPGSLVGELAMLTEHAYGATVIADTRVHCLKILRAALYEQMAADPALADSLASVLAQRLTQVAIEMRAIDEMLAPREDPAPTVASPDPAAAQLCSRPSAVNAGPAG